MVGRLLESGEILKAGRNVWRLRHDVKFKFLLDPAEYFSDLRNAFLHCRKQAWIINWDFNSSVRLLPGSEPMEAFLEELLESRPELHIYCLIWKSPIFFGTDREKFLNVKLGMLSHPRLHFRYDDDHPLSGSQHQKFVVIDDAVAYVGGIDLTAGRWDTPDHSADNRLRVNMDGSPYGPFHDVMARLGSNVARDAGDLARRRWAFSTGERVDPVDPAASFWPDAPWDLERAAGGLARTEPSFKGRGEVKEIERLYLDLIRSAEEFIYIENQYFTSSTVGNAIADCLRRESGPEVLLVLSPAVRGWLEKQTLEILKHRVLRKLLDCDAHGRLSVRAPWSDGVERSDFTLHSKTMIVDDRFFLTGSANINERSMGLDLECNFVLDGAESEPTRRVIRGMRLRLLADQLGVPVEEAERLLSRARTLREAVDSRPSSKRGLDPLHVKDPDPSEREWADSKLLDLERPLPMDYWLDQISMLEKGRSRLRRLGWSLGAIGLAASVGALWLFPGFRHAVSLQGIEGLLGRVAESRWTPIAVLGIYGASALVFVPINVLIIATAGLFNWSAAVLYILSGSYLNASVGYWLGRVLGKKAAAKLFGEKGRALSRKLSHGGVLPLFLVRMVPFLPFGSVNFLCGAFRIDFWSYSWGTVLGLIPGSVAFLLLGKSLMSLARDFGAKSAALFLVSAGIAIWGVKSIQKRLSRVP